jgi:hypothetical protein
MGIWKNIKVLLCVFVGLSSGKVIRAIQRLNGFKGVVMTVEELRDYLNDLIESGQKDKEVVIKYFDDEYDVMRYESLERINTEKTFFKEKIVVALEGSGINQ